MKHAFMMIINQISCHVCVNRHNKYVQHILVTTHAVLHVIVQSSDLLCVSDTLYLKKLIDQ